MAPNRTSLIHAPLIQVLCLYNIHSITSCASLVHVSSYKKHLLHYIHVAEYTIRIHTPHWQSCTSLIYALLMQTTFTQSQLALFSLHFTHLCTTHSNNIHSITTHTSLIDDVHSYKNIRSIRHTLINCRGCWDS